VIQVGFQVSNSHRGAGSQWKPNLYWFRNLWQARARIDAWRRKYNSALENVFRRAGGFCYHRNVLREVDAFSTDRSTTHGGARTRFPWHWAPVGVFVLYAALNMLDRQLLAAVAPALKAEFHLSNAQYGGLVSIFYAVSTAAAPLAGLFIDRVGLKLGASLAIVLWSVASAATGWTQSLRGLMLCRFGLGLGESGGSAAPGAALASYLGASELSLGAAMLGLGTSLGAIAAPLIAAAISPRYG
jgi:ACS family hexuronate transporter-like MFS transporter